MSTKEEVLAAAAKKFKTVDAEIGTGVKVTLRELSRSERDALDKRLWEHAPDGKLAEKDVDGVKMLIPKKDVHYSEEWLAATMIPAMTVDELLADEWPGSLKDMLRIKAQNVNGLTIQEAAGN